MPIKNRIDMLSTGIRTPVGIKVLGADLRGDRAHRRARSRPCCATCAGTRSVFAERTAGGYFLDFELERDGARALRPLGRRARSASSPRRSAARTSTTTIEGRERYRSTCATPRELRDDPDELAPRARRRRRPARRSRWRQLARHAAQRGAGDDPQRERPARRLRLRRHRRARHRRLRRRGQARGRRAGRRCPPGYSLQWSGQYENMLRVRERLEARRPAHARADLPAALPEHPLGGEDRHRAPGRAVLGDRRGLAPVARSTTTSRSPPGSG